MKWLFFLIFILIPFTVFADESYVFLIDEFSTPKKGFKILETDREDVFISKTEPLKQWIINLNSKLIVVKNGYVYPVVDSIIVDKKKATVLLLINFSERKPLYFTPQKYSIDIDIDNLIKNKKTIMAKIDLLLGEKAKLKKSEAQQLSSNELIELAQKYEIMAQWDRAIEIYEEILKNQPKNLLIYEKIGLLYYKTGNFKKALESFQKLPTNESNLFRIIGISIILKDFDRAAKLLNEQFYKNPYAHYLKGIVYYLKGNKEEAYKEVSILIKIDKNLAENLRDLLR